MAQLTADFETGVNGNNIATSDAGSGTAFDLVTRSANGLAVYDNAHPAFGSLAGKFGATGVGGGSSRVEWNAAFGTQTDHYGRVYLYLSAYDGAGVPIIFAGQGATRGARIDFSGTGKLGGFDSAAAALFPTFTTAIALNQLVRIEYHIIHSATVGQCEVKLFNTASSNTPDETQTGAANKNTLANATSMWFGVGIESAVSTSYAIWMDNLVANATSYPGPVGVQSPPFANVTITA